MRKLFYIVLAFILSACQFPQFSMNSGGKSNAKGIPGNTIQVDFFQNNAPLAGSNVSVLFSESLRDLMQSQTSLSLVSKDGDLYFGGTITEYKVNPIGIQAGSETAAQNRLTMSLKATHTYPKLDSIVFQDALFSAYVDFDSDNEFASVEEELIGQLNYQLTQKIYDKAFGSSW